MQLPHFALFVHGRITTINLLKHSPNFCTLAFLHPPHFYSLQSCEISNVLALQSRYMQLHVGSKCSNSSEITFKADFAAA